MAPSVLCHLPWWSQKRRRKWPLSSSLGSVVVWPLSVWCPEYCGGHLKHSDKSSIWDFDVATRTQVFLQGKWSVLTHTNLTESFRVVHTHCCPGVEYEQIVHLNHFRWCFSFPTTHHRWELTRPSRNKLLLELRKLTVLRLNSSGLG